MTKLDPIDTVEALTAAWLDERDIETVEDDVINPYGSGPLPIEPRQIDHDEEGDETRRKAYLAQASRR